MKLIDLLRMSSGSLRRRKLRTFLTVLGVVIGTASIVVMISLGLGLQQSVYDQVEQSGGVTSIQVSGKNDGSGGGMMMQGGDSEEADKYVTDNVVKKLKEMEHVTSASPVLSVSSMLVQGSYMSYIDLQGMDHEALTELNIPLKPGGKLPSVGSSNLEFVTGNMLPAMFYEKSSGKGYWETGVLPDINMMKKSSFLMLDAEAYMNAEQNKKTFGSREDAGGGDGTDKANIYKKTTPPKKHIVRASGEVEGDVNSYNAHSYSVYCDLESLKMALRKEYAGKAIPGQPTMKSGKPYSYLTYSMVHLKVDEMDNVEPVAQAIRDMGFNVQSNIELMDSMKSQLAIIQAVLGGIGAVSLLVAAIGIANTMMMSIYERTKEIGVYKVLGCGLKNIKQLFLLEAAFIGLMGGIIGNILSVLMSVVINVLAKSSGGAMGIEGNISVIPPWLALASMVFAVFVGMAAGYFPALRAMQLSPLAAIRND